MRRTLRVVARHAHEIPVRVDQRLLQVPDEKGHVLVAAVRALLRTFQDDLFDRAGQFRQHLPRGDDLLLQMLERDLHRGIPVKGNAPGQHLVHRDPEGIDVAARV